MNLIIGTAVLLALQGILFTSAQNSTRTNTTTITTIISTITTITSNSTNSTSPPRGNTTMPSTTPRPANSTNMMTGTVSNSTTVVVVNANFGPLLLCWFPCLRGNCNTNSQTATNGAETIGGGASWWGGFSWWKNVTQPTAAPRTQRRGHRRRRRKGWFLFAL